MKRINPNVWNGASAVSVLFFVQVLDSLQTRYRYLMSNVAIVESIYLKTSCATFTMPPSNHHTFDIVYVM